MVLRFKRVKKGHDRSSANQEGLAFEIVMQHFLQTCFDLVQSGFSPDVWSATMCLVARWLAKAQMCSNGGQDDLFWIILFSPPLVVPIRLVLMDSEFFFLLRFQRAQKGHDRSFETQEGSPLKIMMLRFKRVQKGHDRSSWTQEGSPLEIMMLRFKQIHKGYDRSFGTLKGSPQEIMVLRFKRVHEGHDRSFRTQEGSPLKIMMLLFKRVQKGHDRSSWTQEGSPLEIMMLRFKRI